MNFAIVEINMVTVKFELYKNKRHITVENFIKLANDGFYDSLMFHRVIDDFIIQSGEYNANCATSQFFICDDKQLFFDNNYAAFGKIIVGIDAIRDVASVETNTKYKMQD